MCYTERYMCRPQTANLQMAGVIQPVQFSDWAAPIVPVLKKDGSLRICGDLKLTFNQLANSNVYPLPKVDDLFATLSGGDNYTKLDLAQAYQQQVHPLSSPPFCHHRFIASHFVTGTFCCEPLRREDTWSPAIWSR